MISPDTTLKVRSGDLGAGSGFDGKEIRTRTFSDPGSIPGSSTKAARDNRHSKDNTMTLTETERVTLEELRERLRDYWSTLDDGTLSEVTARHLLEDVRATLNEDARQSVSMALLDAARNARSLSGKVGSLGRQAGLLVYSQI